MPHTIGISLDETTGGEGRAGYSGGVQRRENAGACPCRLWPPKVAAVYPAPLARTSPFLQHPVFNTPSFGDGNAALPAPAGSRDLSLTTSMIPLGSCTMKLNGTAEMLPVSWPEFARLHPFAPLAQTRGYQAIFRQLEQWLAEITGLAAVLPPAQLRRPRRIRRPAGHPQIPRNPRPAAAARLPHPRLRPRHQPRQRRHGRLAHRPRRLRQRRATLT